MYICAIITIIYTATCASFGRSSQHLHASAQRTATLPYLHTEDAVNICVSFNTAFCMLYTVKPKTDCKIVHIVLVHTCIYVPTHTIIPIALVMLIAMSLSY